MEDYYIIQSYLANKMGVHQYQVWMYTDYNHQWTLIDFEGFKENIPPNFIPFFNITDQRLWKQDNQTRISFQYEYGCKIVVSMDNATYFDDDTLNILYYLLYPIYTKEVMKSKESALEKLIEGVQDISSSLHLDELLSKILENLAEMIPGCDTSALWLFDPQSDLLICKAYRGWKPEIEKVKFKISEGVVGKTYLDGKTRIYTYKEGVEAMKGTSKENSHFLWKAFHHKRIKITVTMPITVKGETTGVLAIQQTNDSTFSEWDFQLLKGLSGQLAIAIENASLFTEVMKKNEILIKGNKIHKKLTYFSLLNKGLEAITDELNRELDIPIFFVDVLEEEHFPIKKNNSLLLSIDELKMIFLNRNAPLYVDLLLPEELSLYLHPIVIEDIFLGCLVAKINISLTQLEQMTIEQGGLVLAFELVKRQSLTELNYKKLHKFFNELLRNNDPLSLYTEGLHLGIDLKGHLLAISFEFISSKKLKEFKVFVQRLTFRIQQTFHDFNKIVFGFNKNVTVLFSLQDPNRHPYVIEQLIGIVREWKNVEGVSLFAGVGTLNKGIESISNSHSEANKALTYLLSRNIQGLIQYSEIGINRLFLQQSFDEVNTFLKEIFSPLRSKKNQSIELEKTLIVYIKSNRSATYTAKKLHIHTNTLYQRLRKIEELLGVSFDNSEDILKMHLACHLRDTFINDS